MSNIPDFDFIVEYAHPFSNCSLSVSRETHSLYELAKIIRKMGLFFIGNSTEKQSKTRGRKWSSASLQCPTCEVSLSLKEDRRKLELHCSTARAYLSGNNNDAIIFPKKQHLIEDLILPKRKAIMILKKPLKICIAILLWGLVVGDSFSAAVIMEAYCVLFLMKRIFKIYHQQRPYSPKTVSFLGCAEFCCWGGGIG